MTWPPQLTTVRGVGLGREGQACLDGGQVQGLGQSGPHNLPGSLLGEADDPAGRPRPGVTRGLGELVPALAKVVLVRVDHLGGEGVMKVEDTMAHSADNGEHGGASGAMEDRREVPWCAL